MDVQWIGICLISLAFLVLAILLIVGIFWIRGGRFSSSRVNSTVSRAQLEEGWSIGPGAIRLVRLLSDSEAAFYWTLKKAIGERWVIAVKVPLAQMMKRRVYLPSGLHTMLENGQVDFLLLHPRSWEPVVAIELDDATHLTPIRQERDRRKDELFRIAGIPLLRWRVGQSWNVEEIAQAIWKATAPAKESLPSEMQ